MYIIKLTLLFLLIQQVSFAQDADVKTYTFKIRKPTVTGESFLTPLTMGDAFGEDVIGGAMDNGIIDETEPEITLEYPAAATDLDVAGIVYIRYELDEDGNTTNIRVVRGVHPVLEEAALNYVRNMKAKKVKPGSGKKATVRFTIPLKF